MGSTIFSREETARILNFLGQECEKKINESLQENDGEDGWCGMAWDNILCWNRTRPGTIARLPCPEYISDFNTAEYAERECTANGEWWFNPTHNATWTNFTRCLWPDSDISIHAVHGDNITLLYTIGYSVSLVALVVATVIMVCWRRLHSKSTTLHINLFLAFIMRAAMAFMKTRLFVGNLGLPQDVVQVRPGRYRYLDDVTHWECRTLYSLFMFSISATHSWFLMEGLYLYMLVHKTMATERVGVKPYIIVGWALPWTFLIPWVVVKSVFENTGCWNVPGNPSYFWILSGPWTAIVVVNFFFFLDIIRVLIVRVRNNQRHAGRSQYRKFGKFILVLIPLFGIMYIVLSMAFPDFENKDSSQSKFNVLYLYVEMIYNSFQGFILALLFCFLNEDVHTELRRSWRKSNFFKRGRRGFGASGRSQLHSLRSTITYNDSRRTTTAPTMYSSIKINGVHTPLQSTVELGACHKNCHVELRDV